MYTYPIDSIMKWNGKEVSDHNRGPLSVNYEKFNTEHRMVNATLRRLSMASDRRTFKAEWKDLFNDDMTVDGFMGHDSIKRFYENTPGDFELLITNGDGTTEKIKVMFQEMNYSISKRSANTDFYDIGITMVEV